VQLDTGGDRVHCRRMMHARTELGSHFSEGARLLWRVMAKQKLSQADIRRRMQCQSGLVPRWLYGDVTPGLMYAFRLAAAFDIPPQAWIAPPKRHFAVPHS
jgi:hypothetical protein